MDAEANKKETDMLSQKELEDLESIHRRFQELMSDPENVNDAANFLVEDLIDEMIIGVVFEVHRSAKLGVLDPEADMSGEDVNKFKIVDDPGLDVFGQPPVIKKFQDCICPSCNRGLAASRFAPHLEKCMGMGRNSSRIASRRIANNSKETSTIASEDEDDEWTIGGDRRRKKKDRSNGTSKKPSKSVKSEKRNGDSNNSFGSVSESLGSSSGNSSSYDATSAALETMRPDERRNLLSHICGVVSEHTRKLCTRSLRCPQHSDEQRRALRSSVLDDDSSFQSEIQVNVESLGLDPDDLLSGLGGGVGSLSGLGMSSLSRGSWETERSNASSPADSVSVSSSTSSKKREKSSPGKSGSHKKKSKHSLSHEL